MHPVNRNANFNKTIINNIKQLPCSSAKSCQSVFASATISSRPKPDNKSSPQTSENNLEDQARTSQNSLYCGTFANLVSSMKANDILKETLNDNSTLIARSSNSSSHYEPHCDRITKDGVLGIKAELADIIVDRDDLFNDSIDLSPEDIQKTLSANLSSHSSNQRTPNSLVDANPMDFIDNDVTSSEDDVLANLYAFDMLTDFPDLENYDTSPVNNSNHSDSCSSSSTLNKSRTNQSQQTLKTDFSNSTAIITDYSPEWAYPEVGACDIA